MKGRDFILSSSRVHMLGLVLCTGSSLSFAQAAPADADAPAAKPEQGRARALEEIVVTADRRDTNLQDTPMAVTAFTGAAMEQARVQNFGDLVTKIPGFSINSLSRSRTNPALRGGSSSLSAPGSDNAVALFVDDIYYGSSGDFEIDLFDIERVEVLRGPQGTLFGRNSTGGSIAIVTKEPSAEAGGSVEASIGNYDLIQARGFFTGPINTDESVLGSLAFTSTNQGGTSFNRTENRDVDTTNRMSLRGKVKWLINDDVNLLLSGDFSRKNETNEARDFLGPQPTATGLTAVGFSPDNDSRTVDQYDNGTFDSTSWGVSAKLEAVFESGTFYSITGYRHSDVDQTPTDLLGVPVLTIGIGEPRRMSQLTEELRWVSESDGPLSYVGGLYLLHQNEERDIHYQTLYDPSTFAGALQALTFCPLQGGELNFATPACVAAQPELFDPNFTETYQDSTVNSYAAYLQGIYEITDDVNFTLGGRVTYDRKTARGYTRGDLDFIVNPTAVVGGFEGTAGGYRVNGLRDNWTAFTPKATLDWKLNPDLMFYATVSKGYRSGAFQLEAEQSSAVVPVEPEYVLNYEVGFKSRLFDSRAQFNVAVFQANYDNIQFSFTDGTTGNLIVSNAGEAKVSGAEVEAMFIVTDGLTLSANYSYQDGEVSGFPIEAGIADGQDTGQTPLHTLNLGANYEMQLASGGMLNFAVDYQHKSEYQLEINPDPSFTSEVNGLVNASMSYQTPNGKWHLSLWGKNLTDEDIIIYGQDFRFMVYSFDEAYNPGSATYNPAAATANMPRYAAPRTYGATVRLDF